MDNRHLSNSREAFLLEQDWHIAQSALSLLSTVIIPLKEMKREEAFYLEEKVLEIQQLLKGFTENHSFVLGKVMEPNRFTSTDYPVEFMEYIRTAPQEALFEKFQETSNGMKEQEIQEFAKAVTHGYHSLFLLINKLDIVRKQLVSKKIGLLNLRKKKHLANTEDYTEKLLEAKKLIKKRLLSLIQSRYKEVVQLFEYKWLFVYLREVFSPKLDFPKMEKEELRDSFQSLQVEVNTNLMKVSEDDLWLLGNHVFEKYGQLLNQELHFMGEGQMGQVNDAKAFRENVIQAVITRKDASYLLLLLSLMTNEDFIERLHEEILLFRQLYQLLNASLLAVIQKYENGDLAELASLGIVESEELFTQFINVLGFRYDTSYDDLSSGIPVNIETCSTLDVERTTNPAEDMFVSKVHYRGIFHHHTCIRRNLVTVYNFQLEAEKE